MINLSHLQSQFQNYLLQSQLDIQPSIVNTEKVSAAKRLDIYQDAYRTRLIETLASNYPILHLYLGCEGFQKLAEGYLEHYPSPFRSIRWFGDTLSNYLKNDEQPYLSELAQFEWNLTLAFDAADAPILDIEQVAAVPPEAWAEMRFTTHPSVHLINLQWNVVPIWQALSNEQAPVEPIEEAASWIIWRNEYMSRFYSPAQEEAWAMKTLMQNANFGELCGGLCEWYNEEEVGMQAASFLKGWIQSGLLSTLIL